MKTYLLMAMLLITFHSHSKCQGPIDLIVIGDSQTGATWSKSYFGNFLQSCLRPNFVILGKGGSNPVNWLKTTNLENIEIIKRDPNTPHLNLGPGPKLELCERRIPNIIDSYQPKKLLLFFGDNMIASTDEDIKKEINELISVLDAKNIKRDNCYFLTPTFEMEVKDKRNVTRKNLSNTERIKNIISTTINDQCQHIDGLEIMKGSAYFDGKELLKRQIIEGKPGCGGAAQNDNIHICGEAAKDLAEKVCLIFNNLFY